MISEIKLDFNRYKEPENRFKYEEISFYMILLYRICRQIRTIRFFPFRLIVNLIFVPLYFMLTHISGIQLPRGCTIGAGLRIFHFGCIVLNPLTVIGENCTMRHGVTIGNRQEVDDVPVLGDNVDIGAGAKILGRIKIGNNVSIGANAVVLCDVPDNHIAVGVPARIFPKKDN